MFVSVEDTAVSSRIHNPDQLHNIEWYWVHLAMTGIDLTTLMIIGPDCIYKCKSNYHSIAAMTPPAEIRYFCQKTPIPSFVVGLYISHMWNARAMPPFIHAKRVWSVMYTSVRGIDFSSVPTTFRLDFRTVLMWDMFSFSLFYPI
jgi:hypothetical protein